MAAGKCQKAGAAGTAPAAPGMRLSWNARFHNVAEALRGPEYSEDDAHEAWTSARKSLVPPEAYVKLVDMTYRIVESVRMGSGSNYQAHRDSSCNRFVCSDAVQDEQSVVLPPWLPRWCLAGDTAAGAEAAEERSDTASSEAGAMLWFGDLPEELATARRIVEVLHDHRPTAMPDPVVRKVVRHGYRTQEAQSTEVVPVTQWLGYAFLVFRDRAEADEALSHFDGRRVDGGWTVRARWAEEKHQGKPKPGRRLGSRLQPCCDPPLGEQLFPSSLHGQELAAALVRHRAALSVELPSCAEAWVVAEAVKAFYRLYPRREIEVSGQWIPERLQQPLLAELRRTRWPAIPHRSGMQAQEYLVLHRGNPNEVYVDLLALLEQLLSWAAPEFACNRIAVTKDFQGSPHIDSSDVTCQYVTSLGDFSTGGQLCIEGLDPTEVFVVETKGRIAKIDARFVHWVRGHSGGERYSVLFFSTDPQQRTKRMKPFHQDWLPADCDAVGSVCSSDADAVPIAVNSL